MAEKVLMKGNEAIAEAAIRAGCHHYFGYPITPQTEIAAYMSKRMPKIGGTFLQGESEIASINMVLGAASAGVRAMTSSSSPGISLKSEGISYLAGSDLPALIVSVQRGGPGLGGIQPAQSDYWQATRATGHGDFQLLVYAPSTVQEMVDMVFIAFDRAEEYRVPAMILIDGILGQMMEPVDFSNVQEAHSREKNWAVTGHGNKREHNIINSLYLAPDELEQHILERYQRYAIIEEKEPRYEAFMMDDAEYCVVAYGGAARIARNAVREARGEGIKVGMIRPITLWPFPKKAIVETPNVKRFLAVEMSMGQMIDDVRLALNGRCPVDFCGRTGGIIPTPAEVHDAILNMVGGAK